MTRKNLPIEVGNFVCLFGEEELLDSFKQRIWPIVSKNNKVTWTFGEDLYYVFYKFKVLEHAGEHYLCGQLVRKMRLTSSQDYKENEDQIKYRSKTMADSPSSFVCLRLFDHKVFVMRETVRAPGMQTLEKIFRKGLMEHRKSLHENELAKYKKRKKRKRLTKEQKGEFVGYFNAKFPLPDFRITPKASIAKIDELFKHVKEVNTLRVTFYKTNQEDPKFRTAILKQLQDSKDTIGNGHSSVVRTEITDKEKGLSISKTKEVLKDTSKSNGNVGFNVKAIGENDEGLNIKDSNLEVRDSVPNENLPNIESKVVLAAKKLDDLMVKATSAYKKNWQPYIKKAEEIYEEFKNR